MMAVKYIHIVIPQEEKQNTEYAIEEEKQP